MNDLPLVDDTTFPTQVLARTGDTLVEFTASWCGPCRALHPVLAAIARERPELQVVLVDVDEAPDTARRYRVRGTPTLALFRGGEAASLRIGAATKAAILAWLDENAAPARP